MAEPLCSPHRFTRGGGFLRPPCPSPPHLHPAQLQPSWTEGQTDRRQQSWGTGRCRVGQQRHGHVSWCPPGWGQPEGGCVGVCVLRGGGGGSLPPALSGEKDTASRLLLWCRWPSRAGQGHRPGRWAGWGSRAPPSAVGKGRSEPGPPIPEPSQTAPPPPPSLLSTPRLQSCTSLSFTPAMEDREDAALSPLPLPPRGSLGREDITPSPIST